MNFSIDVSSAPPAGATDLPAPLPVVPDTIELLRQILEVQKEQLAHQRNAATAHDMTARWRSFLSRWNDEFPGLSDNCRKALPLLERTYGRLIAEMADRLNDEDENLDNDFTLQEFLDRYGMRLAQLGTILNLVAPLAEAGSVGRDRVNPYLAKRRELLRRLYGFDFPDDLFRFWDFANRLRPLEPLTALAEVCQVQLVGPFEVLAGRFDRHTPRYSLLLHWRYYDDPPEFFTVLLGDRGGLHWGYYLDDPRTQAGCVASYDTNDAFELMTDGDTLFDALRLHLEEQHRDCLECRGDDPEYRERYDATLAAIAEMRRELRRYETDKRSEVGEEYVEKYQAERRRARRIVARTQDGMGIVAPREEYRPLSSKDKKLWQTLWREDDPAPLVEEARQALRDGYPATALKLGKDLWAVGGERHTDYAYELLDAAYAALGRDALREVLREHRTHRNLPLVDILALEEEGRVNGAH